ncbi:hypothetical protein P8452_09908 [Trifolium repens]|nr:hypothetical protein P8452_09908 [Trifolium repens]
MVSASEPSLPTSAFELCSAFEVPTPPEMLSLSSLTGKPNIAEEETFSVPSVSPAKSLHFSDHHRSLSPTESLCIIYLVLSLIL